MSENNPEFSPEASNENILKSNKSNSGNGLFWTFILVAIFGLFGGIIQERSEYSNAWKVPGYEDFLSNTSFQTKNITADTCSSNSVNGCWLYSVVSAEDCDSVFGSHSQIRKSDEKELRSVDVEVNNVTRGVPFDMEFPADYSESLVGDLISLECVKV